MSLTLSRYVTHARNFTHAITLSGYVTHAITLCHSRYHAITPCHSRYLATNTDRAIDKQNTRHCEVVLVDEVVALPAEERVRLLVDDQTHVPRLDARPLVRLPAQQQLRVRGRPGLDVHVERLALAHHLLPRARGALLALKRKKKQQFEKEREEDDQVCCCCC